MTIYEWRLLRAVPLIFARMGIMLGKYWDSTRRRDRIKLLVKIRSKRDMLLLPCEACQIMSLVDAVKNVPGDMAELGVASGASSKMISACAPERKLHIFDTFEGLPDPSGKDSSRFKKRQYHHNFEEVREYLKGNNIILYKGVFPGTARDISNARFAFVHLDTDLYESTKAGLEWFYPRLNKGGILISHDYDTSVGVNQAFEEFFAGRPEPYFDLVGSQCMFVKM